MLIAIGMGNKRVCGIKICADAILQKLQAIRQNVLAALILHLGGEVAICSLALLGINEFSSFRSKAVDAR
jgi:hypothetical protein